MISLQKILITSLVLGFCLFASAQKYNCMTYNIRYDNPEDGIHNWHERKEEVVDFLKESNPDVLGIQEGLENQVSYLDENLPNHTYVGVGRKDGKTAGEYTALYFNSLKFDLVDSGTFWLSETPDTVSVGWDAALPRICTWARLRTLSSSKDIVIFNTHFDHRGTKARRKAAKLIFKKVSALNPEKLPMVLMGDFNLTPDTRSIRFLQRKFIDPISYDIPLHGPRGTSSGFDSSNQASRRIDYIFILKAEVWTYQHADPRRLHENHHLSDHLPVMVQLEI